MAEPTDFNFDGASCPVPLHHTDQIVIGHGSGGKMTQELISQVFLRWLDNSFLRAGNDAAGLILPTGSALRGRLSMSTDSHIVHPLFFPGGDIGRLAVCGTVNDVSMLGAQVLYLTAGFILEEGLPVETLERVVASMRAAADEAGVLIVAGDTKVVEKGKADGLFINTAGLGWIPEGCTIGGDQARPGDAVLISGTIGDHGIAVLSARGDLGIESEICSDVAPLNHMIQSLLQAAPRTHVLRDPTRGGLATTLNEIAVQSHVGIQLEEAKIPVQPAVRAACEMLGFDPLYIANEGKLIAIVPSDEADAALAALRQDPHGAHAVQIGKVVAAPAKRVMLKTLIGGTRLLDVLAGEMLPRIC
ncbi:MAG TPA: hydrogenase expression/formation protein HypE [Anaerolineaceae bacterium]|nr:hydrogenase expression/formation protein HypE [Anaerolineaceae bacterium]